MAKAADSVQTANSHKVIHSNREKRKTRQASRCLVFRLVGYMGTVLVYPSPVYPSRLTAIGYRDTGDGYSGTVPMSPVIYFAASMGTGSETMTLWSYHLPFVPTRAKSNSSPMTGTGMSKP